MWLLLSTHVKWPALSSPYAFSVFSVVVLLYLYSVCATMDKKAFAIFCISRGNLYSGVGWMLVVVFVAITNFLCRISLFCCCCCSLCSFYSALLWWHPSPIFYSYHIWCPLKWCVRHVLQSNGFWSGPYTLALPSKTSTKSDTLRFEGNRKIK